MRYIKHKKWRDTCYKVLSFNQLNEENFEVHVIRYNLGWVGNPFVVHNVVRRERFTITDFNRNWEVIEPDLHHVKTIKIGYSKQKQWKTLERYRNANSRS